MKRLIPLILALCMVLTLLSACGAETTSAPESAPASEAQSAEAPAAPAQPAPADAEASAEEASAAEEVFQPLEPRTYPLADGDVSFTILHSEPMLGPMSGQMNMDDYGDFETIAAATEYIGVTPEWSSLSQMTGDTQFNLVVASGDYPDVFTGIDKYYSGSFQKAFEDEVIIQIDEYLPEGMPLYWNLIHEDPALLRAVTGDDNGFYAWYSIFDKIVVNEGYFIRKDWCDKLGMDIPTTIDDINDFAYGIKDKLGLESVILLGEELGTLIEAWGLNGSVAQGSGFAYHRVGDELAADVSSPEYEDYITQLHQWYVDGIVSKNFSELSTANMAGDMEQELYDGRTGIVATMVNSMDNLNNPDEGYELAAMVVTKDGGNLHTGSSDRQFDSCSVSSTCDPELIPYIMGWMDYWYSDEGAMAMCYGVKGLDYDIDPDGTIRYLENITQNEYGYPPMLFSRARCFSGAAFGLMYEDRTRPFFTEAQEAAIDTWTARTDGELAIPGALSLNSEESDVVALYATDLATYISEEIPKFVLDEQDMSKWGEFIENCEGMHLQELVDAYQGAYDRYATK